MRRDRHFNHARNETMRLCADDELPKRVVPQHQPGGATLGCALAVGLLLPLAVILWATAVRLTLRPW